MLSDLILQAVLLVLASIFFVMIYVAWSKQRSKRENLFLVCTGSAFASLGLGLAFWGILGMGKGYHGSPVLGAMISLVGLLLAAVSGIIGFKARTR